MIKQYILIFLACIGGLGCGYLFGKYMPVYILVPTVIGLSGYLITELVIILKQRRK